MPLLQPDLRSSERIYVTVPVRLVSPSDGVLAELPTFQLGEGGCSVLGPESVPVGRVITVELALNGVLLRPVGQVVYEQTRAGEVLTGIRFISVTAEEKETIRNFVQTRLISDPESALGTRTE